MSEKCNPHDPMLLGLNAKANNSKPSHSKAKLLNGDVSATTASSSASTSTSTSKSELVSENVPSKSKAKSKKKSKSKKQSNNNDPPPSKTVLDVEIKGNIVQDKVIIKSDEIQFRGGYNPNPPQVPNPVKVEEKNNIPSLISHNQKQVNQYHYVHPNRRNPVPASDQKYFPNTQPPRTRGLEMKSSQAVTQLSNGKQNPFTQPQSNLQKANSVRPSMSDRSRLSPAQSELLKTSIPNVQLVPIRAEIPAPRIISRPIPVRHPQTPKQITILQNPNPRGRHPQRPQQFVQISTRPPHSQLMQKTQSQQQHAYQINTFQQPQSRDSNGSVPSHLIYSFPPAESKYEGFFFELLKSDCNDVWRFPTTREYANLPPQRQLKELVDSLALNERAIRDRMNVLLDLKCLLKQEFPYCEIYPFGSYLTGLGDLTSDVDVYFDAFGVTKGHPLPPHNSSTIDILNHCNKILRQAKCLRSNRYFSNQLQPIRGARVPILKFTHSLTSVNVDLSFENLISLRNSELIKLYMMLHPVVRPVLVIIRFWAKFHGLTGSTSIKNYGLILIVLVFLTNKGIVPSIAKLQKMKHDERDMNPNAIPNTESDIIDGWDTSFPGLDAENLKKIQQKFPSSIAVQEAMKNLHSIVIQLLKEFFTDFAKVNFEEKAICAYTSQFLDKHLFAAGNEEDLPDALDRYKSWSYQQTSDRRLNYKTPLCLVDPFVLSYNVGAVTPDNILYKFQIACSQTAEILERGITTFVVMFSRLPHQVGDRKFMSLQEKHKKTIQIKREVEHATKHQGLPIIQDQNESVEDVPIHLRPMSEIVGTHTVLYGKGFESVMTFDPDPEFRKLFAMEIIRHKFMTQYTKTVLLNKLKVLWISFVQDFLAEFFEKSFQLNVKKEEWKVNQRIYRDPVFSMKTTRNYELIFSEYQKKMEFSEFQKKKQKNSKTQLDESLDTDKSRSILLKDKLDQLETLDTFTMFQKLHCSTIFAVWEGRDRLYHDVVNNSAKAIHGGNSSGNIAANQQPKPRKKKSKQKILKNGVLELNPLDIESQVTNLVLEREKKSSSLIRESPTKKPVLKFSTFIKFECCFADDLPTLYVVFDKVGNNTHNYKSGAAIIAESFQDDLPIYIQHRTHAWLMLSGESSSTNNDLASTTTIPTSASSPGKEVPDEEEVEDDDYDLLLPPTSSSSECSSPVPRNVVTE